MAGNDAGHAIRVPGCLGLFQVALVSSTYYPAVAWPLCLQAFMIPAGQSCYPVTVRASYSQCSQGRPQDGLRACLPDRHLPPLPAGEYHAELFQPGNLVPVPPAIAVRVAPPESVH